MSRSWFNTVSWSFGHHFAALVRGVREAPGAEQVLADLRRALEAELRRRGLWSAPPSYLGVLGQHHWDREALDELANECYLYQLGRLRSLAAHLEVGADLDRFVLLNVRHFVFERQRSNDPLGYRVFQLLTRAIERGAGEGTLRLPGYDGRLRNDAVITLASRAGEEPLAGKDALARVASRWNGDLLPALVTAAGHPQLDAVVARLAAHLAALPEDSVFAFRLGDLAEPLKADARRRWAAISEDPEGTATVFEADRDVGSPVRIVLPDTSIGEREHFERLTSCAATSLARLPPGQHAGELLSLLSVLVRHARDPSSDEALSQRALARAAAVPRHRVTDHLACLREVIDACGRTIDGARPVTKQRWLRQRRGDSR